MIVSDLVEIKSISAGQVDRDRLATLLANIEKISNLVISNLECEKEKD